MTDGVGQSIGAVAETFLGPPLARSAHKCDGFASSNPASTEQTQPPSCAIGNGGWRWINNGSVALAFLDPRLAPSAHICDGSARSNPASIEHTQPTSGAIGNNG